MLNVLGCNNTGKLGICKSIDEHKQKLGISVEYIAKDVIGFVDLYSVNKEQKIKKSFDSSKRMKEAELSINKIFSKSKNKYKKSSLKTGILDFTGFQIAQIINLKWHQKKHILDTLAELLEFMSDYLKIKLIVKSMGYVNEIYKKFNVEMRRIREIKKGIDAFYQNMFAKSFSTIEDNITHLAMFDDLPGAFNRWLELYGIRYITLANLYDDILEEY